MGAMLGPLLAKPYKRDNELPRGIETAFNQPVGISFSAPCEA